MKSKLIVCQVLSTAVGCIAGAIAASAMGMAGGVILAIVLAGVLGTVGINVIFGQEDAVTKPAASSVQPALSKKAELKPASGSLMEEVDILGVSEEMAFASQQLLWGIGHYKNALKSLSNLSESISNQSESNASNLEEASAGVEEIASAACNVLSEAESSLKQCHESSQLAKEHHGKFIEVSQSIMNVAEVVQRAVKDIDDLNVASEKISNFVGKIQGIASQTNLLALNAAIEAARAGEHGRGFAVVAEEVRKLAAESEDTTKEIEEIVREITDKTAIVTQNMQDGSQRLQSVEGMADKSAAAMNNVVTNIQSIETTTDNLCSMSTNQRDTTEQMSKVIETIGHATVAIVGSTQDSRANIVSQQKNVDEITDYAKAVLAIADNMQKVAVKFKKPNEIIFGVNPFVAPNVIRETYVPILNAVAEQMGLKARTVIVSDYESLGKALIDKVADVGWFSPFAYVSAKEQANITPIVTPKVNNATSYTGYIITRKDSGIHTLDDLAGKKFGFVDKKSASGYVYPKAALIEAGKNPEEYFGSTTFLGSHNRVIEAVMQGEVDAGATYSEAMDAAGAQAAAQLDIIFRTDPIPKDAIAAAPGVDKELIKNLMSAFESIKDGNQKCGTAMKKAHINGFVSSKDADYEVVRKAAALK